MKRFEIVLNGRLYDVALFSDDTTAEVAYKTLVEHDGYPRHIVVMGDVIDDVYVGAH